MKNKSDIEKKINEVEKEINDEGDYRYLSAFMDALEWVIE
jgi:hypothetical protein